MSTKRIKKIAVETNDIGGLKSSRYEKLQVSFGSIEASSYSLLDTLSFADVPARDIIRASIVAHTSPVVSLDVYPGTDVSAPLTLAGITSPAKISYVIEYVRGSGRVGPDAYGSNSYGSGESLESGEGDLLQVTIGSIAELTTQQVYNLTSDQVSTLNTTQVANLTTAQVQSMEVSDFASLTTKQIRALETRDVAVITSTELAALSTTQLGALTTAQKAVLTTSQKAGLSTTQIAALA
jgi:uncharacterized membrane protein